MTVAGFYPILADKLPRGSRLAPAGQIAHPLRNDRPLPGPAGNRRHLGGKIMTDFRSAMLGMAVAILVAGSWGSVAAADLADNQVLHKGNGAEPATLDPHKAEAVPDHNILRDLLEGLVAEGPDGKLVPGAAASWDISADGT